MPQEIRMVPDTAPGARPGKEIPLEFVEYMVDQARSQALDSEYGEKIAPEVEQQLLGNIDRVLDETPWENNKRDRTKTVDVIIPVEGDIDIYHVVHVYLREDLDEDKNVKGVTKELRLRRVRPGFLSKRNLDTGEYEEGTEFVSLIFDDIFYIMVKPDGKKRNLGSEGDNQALTTPVESHGKVRADAMFKQILATQYPPQVTGGQALLDSGTIDPGALAAYSISEGLHPGEGMQILYPQLRRHYDVIMSVGDGRALRTSDQVQIDTILEIFEKGTIDIGDEISNSMDDRIRQKHRKNS